jgi:single-strand DNA-binding protein
MELTGRIVADDTQRTVNGDKTVINFRMAVNRSYKSKGEVKEEATFFDCAYWLNPKLGQYLTKGLLVQVYGHVSASAWLDKKGEPQANLNFHTNEITLLGKSERKEKKSEK